MRLVICLIIIVFTYSCDDTSYIDKNSIALVPVENIQFIFERNEDASTLSLFKEKRGNTLILQDLKATLNYINLHKTDLVLDAKTRFIWDTLNVEKKIFLINQKNIFPLEPLEIKSVKTSGDLDATELVLSSKKNESLSFFFAKYIGKEFIAIDKNGFVAGAKALEKSGGDNLLIKNNR